MSITTKIYGEVLSHHGFSVEMKKISDLPVKYVTIEYHVGTESITLNKTEIESLYSLLGDVLERWDKV